MTEHHRAALALAAFVLAGGALQQASAQGGGPTIPIISADECALTDLNKTMIEINDALRIASLAELEAGEAFNVAGHSADERATLAAWCTSGDWVATIGPPPTLVITLNR